MTTPGFFTLAWAPAWTGALINHLWQSTVIALLAWLLTVALQNNAARVRYAIWLFASIKFLVPFSFMTRIGAHWAKPAVDNHTGHAFYSMIEEFSLPLRQAQASVSPTAPVQHPIQALPIALEIVAAVWLFGCIVLLAKWIAGWRRAAQMAGRAEPISVGREFNALRRASRFRWFFQRAKQSREFSARFGRYCSGRAASLSASKMRRSRPSWLMKWSMYPAATI
jgi:hypothetical protein